jgi:hypothetical protein
MLSNGRAWWIGATTLVGLTVAVLLVRGYSTRNERFRGISNARHNRRPTIPQEKGYVPARVVGSKEITNEPVTEISSKVKTFLNGDEFESQTRDPTWAPRMEDEIRLALNEALARFPGADIVDLRCHTSACRLALRLTPGLKQRLRSEDPRGIGCITEKIIRETGAYAPFVYPVWANEGVSSWSDPLNELGLGPLTRWLGVSWSEMLREETILSFGEDLRDPNKYAQWIRRKSGK